MSNLKTIDYQKEIQNDYLIKNQESEELIKSNIRVGKKTRENRDNSGLNLDYSGYQLDMTNTNIHLNNTQTPTNINFHLNNSTSPLNINNTIKLDNNYTKDQNKTTILNRNKNFFDVKIGDDEFLEKINKLNDDNTKKSLLKKMYQFQINFDNNEKNSNFFEDDQKSKLNLTGFVNRDNDIRSKLNQILDKYRAPPQIENIVDNKNNEVENILNNLENMISKNNASKPNELENYINKDENIEKTINNNLNNINNSQMLKLNVSQIKKNSMYNNENNYNLDVSANPNYKNNDENMGLFEEAENLNNYNSIYNPFMHLIIEVDVMENLMFEINKKNKFTFKTDYTSSFYVPDSYEIFVYDPFINFNFNSNLNAINIKNINNRLDSYKNFQHQQQMNFQNNNNSIIPNTVNIENINKNAYLEKLNTSNIDNSIKNNNNLSIRTERENINFKNKNDVNYFINNDGEVEIENNFNIPNFKNSNTNNLNNNINNAPPLISFSSKSNDIVSEKNINNKYEFNFKKDQKQNPNSKFDKNNKTYKVDFHNQDKNKLNSSILHTKARKNSSVKDNTNNSIIGKSNLNKTKKSVIEFNKNNSLNEFMIFYKTNKKDPNFKRNKKTFFNEKFKINKQLNTIKLEELIIINETISQHTEKILLNNNYKCFLGKDIIHKIYFCPNDNIVIFNYEEANKIGVMLLEMLRYEAELADYECLFKNISIKYNEECENFRKEKGRILEEMDIIVEREKAYKKEVNLIWEDIQKKLNISYSELNEFYKENKKYEMSNFPSDRQIEYNNNGSLEKKNLNENFKNTYNNNSNINENSQFINNQFDFINNDKNIYRKNIQYNNNLNI